jgi:hypothetical protein
MYSNNSLHDFTRKDLPKCRLFHAHWPRIRYFRNFLFRPSAAKKSEGRLRDKMKTEEGAGWKIRKEIRETKNKR